MKKIWKDSNDHLLGTVSDIALAKKLGVDYSVVQRHRILRGVSAYRSTQPTAMERHLLALKSYSDEQLMVPIQLFKGGLAPYVTFERKRRGLVWRKGGPKSLDVDPVTLKQAMVKAAYTLKPRPSLEAIGKALGVSRQRIKQILDGMCEVKNASANKVN